MNHIVIGAAVPFLVYTAIYAARNGHASLRLLVITPILMLVFALWAVAPDIPRLLGFHGLYAGLAAAPACDIFFWHYSIDQVEKESRWFTVALVGMLASVLATAWRQLRMEEKR